ncbi:MAG: hypothetical protein ACR2P0_13745 [Acidimicrobiales bacterium]
MATARDGTTGPPTSSNGASSHHVFWELDAPRDDPIVRVAATLRIVETPSVAKLYFWALQATFRAGTRAMGGAHLGLQHHPAYPGNGAANWGGYHRAESGSSGELSGSDLTVASTLRNSNTGDYPWQPGRAYRLAIEPAGPGRWSGSITDGDTGLRTTLRELWVDADRLTDFVVWTEAFADCDAPPVEIRWSDLESTTASGVAIRPPSVRFGYQKVGDGGCSTSSSHAAFIDGIDVVVQRTGVDPRE